MTSPSDQDLSQQLQFMQIPELFSHSQIEAIDDCTYERQRRYDNSIKWYLNHVKRQCQLLDTNIKHSNERNLMLMEDIHKSYHRAFKNTPMVMKIIKQTNREKRNVNKFISETLNNFKENSRGIESNMHESVDLSKYKDILEEYRHKI